MTILFAADLDGTLIFPPGPEATRPVAPTAAMTPRAAELLIDVRSELTFAAVTTRTPPAVKPLSLPPGPVRLLAASNGARIYINGVEDRDWSHYTYGEVIDAEQLEQAVAVLGAAGLRHAQVRDGAYWNRSGPLTPNVYLPAQPVPARCSYARDEAFRVCEPQGRSLPNCLTVVPRWKYPRPAHAFRHHPRAGRHGNRKHPNR